MQTDEKDILTSPSPKDQGIGEDGAASVSSSEEQDTELPAQLIPEQGERYLEDPGNIEDLPTEEDLERN